MSIQNLLYILHHKTLSANRPLDAATAAKQQSGELLLYWAGC